MATFLVLHFVRGQLSLWKDVTHSSGKFWSILKSCKRNGCWNIFRAAEALRKRHWMEGNLVKNLFHSYTYTPACYWVWVNGDKSPIWYFYFLAVCCFYICAGCIRGEIEWDETFKLFLSMPVKTWNLPIWFIRQKSSSIFAAQISLYRKKASQIEFTSLYLQCVLTSIQFTINWLNLSKGKVLAFHE